MVLIEDNGRSLCVFYYCRTYYKAVRVGGGGGAEGECERERALGVLRCHSLGH
jgi:hypothetical protein